MKKLPQLSRRRLRGRDVRRRRWRSKKASIVDIVYANIGSAIAKAGGGGCYAFTPRQLFYILRPIIIDATEREPTWNYFSQDIITRYENDFGEIKDMIRDPRGTLYHPHIGDDIALGSLSVAAYERPSLTFNKILYIEKEGFFEALKAAKWPERHDCALMTSKRYSTRAARDLIDMFAEDDEEIKVFCIHDADAAGTMIWQSLQEETRARPRRKTQIINLGLEPWEAVELGLQVEKIPDRKNSAVVADYVKVREDGSRWVKWLESSRVELNAMTTEELIAWLDRKMFEGGFTKLVPDSLEIEEELKDSIGAKVRAQIEARILKEAGIDKRVEAAMADIVLPPEEELEDSVDIYLMDHPEKPWRAWVEDLAKKLADLGEAS